MRVDSAESWANISSRVQPTQIMYTHKRHSHALSNWRTRVNISEKFIITNISLYFVAEEHAVRM